MSQVPGLKHWRIETGADRVAWCTLDLQGQSANVLSREVLQELGTVIGSLEAAPPSGVVFLSGKDSGFIAGADVREFAAIRDRDQAEAVIHEVHGLLDRLARLSCASVCLVRGFCLGGGLELALACRFIVASDDPGTRLGFPEVMLGIFPGFGGTLRAIRRIGPVQALQMMLTGRSVNGRRARRLGLVDRCVPERQLRVAARTLLLNARPAHGQRLRHRLSSLAPARRMLSAFMRRALRKRVNADHYPAPYRLLSHWEQNGGDAAHLLAGEARAVPDLLMTPTARHLVRAFLLQERLRDMGSGADAPMRHVHVVGAGVMGGDIAAWCAAQGLTVTLQDREPRFIAPAMRRARALFERRLKDPRLVALATDRLQPDIAGDGIPSADLVIEAIIENRDAKVALFRSIEPRMRADAILATNTSSIALEDLQPGLSAPGRLTGIHFFNPVDRMQLVEVVYGSATGVAWVQRAAAFCRQIGRLPLPVRSAPGFLVNRVLTPYLLEATAMLEEGIAAEAVDAAATAFGMPMGPVELADTVGLDICLSVAEHLAAPLQLVVPERLRELVRAGRLGRKSGRGFYDYHDGRPRRSRPPGNTVTSDLAERLVMRMLNECAASLREGIVGDADLLDAGMIFGTGFAPFRGGPMQYARELGTGAVTQRLGELAARHGDRFAPDAWWAGQAK